MLFVIARTDLIDNETIITFADGSSSLEVLRAEHEKFFAADNLEVPDNDGEIKEAFLNCDNIIEVEKVPE